MKTGIIAAGLGERLRLGGVPLPKPLVPVAGRALIDYALAAVTACGLREIACIVNEQTHGVEEHCRRQWPRLRFAFVRRTTPSSMESLFALGPLLQGGRFLLLTVDAVFAPQTLRAFLEAAGRCPAADAVLAVNGFVDDEKPLWVRMDATGRVSALGAAACPGAAEDGMVTAGFYVFSPRIFDEVAAARQRGYGALRAFLGHLLAGGRGVYGVPVAKTVDVDRPCDIAVAEAFVRSGFSV